MENTLQKYIKNYLENSEQKIPIPTDIKQKLTVIPNIKAILFDIYGTLLISSSGDIDSKRILQQNILKALQITGVTIKKQNIQKTADLISMLFVEIIKNIHKTKKRKKIPYPEVVIQDVWEEVLNHKELQNHIKLPASFKYKNIAFVFEILNNPVYPMPGMSRVLKEFSNRIILLGIISNAQFYTPVILNYFITGFLDDKENVCLFTKDCTFFSYEYLRAKPDQYLFDKAKAKLTHYHIEPENTVYVGNDMRNDIYPAYQAGFRSVLFAGDRRSLRLRKGSKKITQVKPDAVITDLRQLPEIIQ